MTHHFLMGVAAATLISLFAIIALALRIFRGDGWFSWNVTISFAVLCILGVGYVWWLVRTAPEVEAGLGAEGQDLAEIVDGYRERVRIDKQSGELREVSVGVSLESVEELDGGDLVFSGIAWQRYLEDENDAVPGFVLSPDIADTRLEERFDIRNGRDRTIGWSFSATVSGPSDVSKFPFERGEVELPIKPREISRRADRRLPVRPRCSEGVDESQLSPSGGARGLNGSGAEEPLHKYIRVVEPRPCGARTRDRLTNSRLARHRLGNTLRGPHVRLGSPSSQQTNLHLSDTIQRPVKRYATAREVPDTSSPITPISVAMSALLNASWALLGRVTFGCSAMLPPSIGYDRLRHSYHEGSSNQPLARCPVGGTSANHHNRGRASRYGLDEIHRFPSPPQVSVRDGPQASVQNNRSAAEAPDDRVETGCLAQIG